MWELLPPFAHWVLHKTSKMCVSAVTAPIRCIYLLSIWTIHNVQIVHMRARFIHCMKWQDCIDVLCAVWSRRRACRTYSILFINIWGNIQIKTQIRKIIIKKMESNWTPHIESGYNMSNKLILFIYFVFIVITAKPAEVCSIYFQPLCAMAMF